MKWWAYLHVEGRIVICPHLHPESAFSYKNVVYDNPFIKKYVAPFDAENKEEAMEKAEELLNG